MPSSSRMNQMTTEAKLQRWKHQMAKEMDMVYTIFTEPRADAVVRSAKKLKDFSDGKVGAIAAVDLCVQIEEEFPGRIDEFIEEATKHPNGVLHGLGQYVRYQRARP